MGIFDIFGGIEQEVEVKEKLNECVKNNDKEGFINYVNSLDTDKKTKERYIKDSEVYFKRAKLEKNL